MTLGAPLFASRRRGGGLNRRRAFRYLADLGGIGRIFRRVPSLWTRAALMLVLGRLFYGWL